MRKFIIPIIILIILLGAYLALNSYIYNKKQGDLPKGDQQEEANWTRIEVDEGFSFKYPPALPSTYITAVDWPPEVQIIDGSFVCTEAGEEIARAGETSKKIINNKEYCVTKVSEGAAGSIYTQYAYATLLEGKTFFFTFSTRAAQCDNYTEAEKTICEAERTTFNIDSLINQIIQTVKFN